VLNMPESEGRCPEVRFQTGVVEIPGDSSQILAGA